MPCYVARSVSQNLYKIGWSKHPERRVNDLRTQMQVFDLTLVCVLTGEAEFERALHHRLRQHRAHIGGKRECYRFASDNVWLEAVAACRAQSLRQLERGPRNACDVVRHGNAA